MNVLIIENHPGDAYLINKRLLQANLDFMVTIVYQESELTNVVPVTNYDIILADNDMPQFDVRVVLCILKKLKLQIPVIALCDKISPELANGLITEGAYDVVHKSSTRQIIRCVERAVRKDAPSKEIKFSFPIPKFGL